MIGLKDDGTNTDVEMDTMSELSCVPALILLNGALRHYGLKMIYFHPKKESDELLSLNQRAYMSRTIRINIPDARKEEMEINFAKEGRKRIGYTRLQVLTQLTHTDVTLPPNISSGTTNTSSTSCRTLQMYSNLR